MGRESCLKGINQKDFEDIYGDYRIYGPYVDARDGRSFVTLRSNESKSSIRVSLARLIVSMELGRKLNTDETIDHIDDDCMNDELSNLQILTRADNTRKYASRYRIAEWVELICVRCKIRFLRMKCNINKGTRSHYCSNSCRQN